MELDVGTDVRDGNGTTRMVNWCGCLIQDPHPAVRALGFLPEEGHGVYVSRWQDEHEEALQSFCFSPFFFFFFFFFSIAWFSILGFFSVEYMPRKSDYF